MKVFDNPMKNLDFTISLIKTHRSALLRRELPQNDAFFFVSRDDFHRCLDFVHVSLCNIFTGDIACSTQ